MWEVPFIVALVLRRRETLIKSLSIQASPGAGEHGGLWLCLLILKAFLSYLLHCVPVIFKEMNSPGLQVHSGYVDVHLLIYLLLISSQADQYCGVWFCFVLVVSSFLFSFLSFLPRISSSLLLLHMFAHIRVSHPWCVTGSWLSVLGKVKWFASCCRWWESPFSVRHCRYPPPLRFTFIVSVWVFWLHVCLRTTCMQSSRRPDKGIRFPRWLWASLWVVGIDPGLRKSRQCS